MPGRMCSARTRTDSLTEGFMVNGETSEFKVVNAILKNMTAVGGVFTGSVGASRIQDPDGKPTDFAVRHTWAVEMERRGSV